MLSAKSKDSIPRKKALQGLREAGLSIPDWATANGFNLQTVKGVLYGHLKGTRGEAHRVAVALGIKSGLSVRAEGFKPVPTAKRRLAVVSGGRK